MFSEHDRATLRNCNENVPSAVAATFHVHVEGKLRDKSQTFWIERGSLAHRLPAENWCAATWKNLEIEIGALRANWTAEQLSIEKPSFDLSSTLRIQIVWTPPSSFKVDQAGSAGATVIRVVKVVKWVQENYRPLEQQKLEHLNLFVSFAVAKDLRVLSLLNEFRLKFIIWFEKNAIEGLKADHNELNETWTCRI